MTPTVTDLLNGCILTLATRPRPEDTGLFASARIRLVAMMNRLVALECADGAAARVWENAALRALIADAGPKHGVAASELDETTDGDCSLHTLDTANARLRRLLIRLHVIDRVQHLRRCIAIDLMGLGYTEISPSQDVSFTAQAQMVAEVIDALGIDKIDLVANDSGGAIAQIFAAHHPERLRSLVLTNCDVHGLSQPPRRRRQSELRQIAAVADAGKSPAEG